MIHSKKLLSQSQVHISFPNNKARIDFVGFTVTIRFFPWFYAFSLNLKHIREVVLKNRFVRWWQLFSSVVDVGLQPCESARSDGPTLADSSSAPTQAIWARTAKLHVESLPNYIIPPHFFIANSTGFYMSTNCLIAVESDIDLSQRDACNALDAAISPTCRSTT